jgi:hypothetical protein
MLLLRLIQRRQEKPNRDIAPIEGSGTAAAISKAGTVVLKTW